jgi:hypothetical protein
MEGRLAWVHFVRRRAGVKWCVTRAAHREKLRRRCHGCVEIFLVELVQLWHDRTCQAHGRWGP